MNKPSQMPPKLASVNAAAAAISGARDEVNRGFLDEYGDQINDVRSIMAQFKDHDPVTAAILTLATAMLTPEDY